MRFAERSVGLWLIALLGLVSTAVQAAVAPQISGSPSTTAVVGTWYAFTPRASDADGDTLRFTIGNKPAWASFDPATGRLSGTPKNAGTFADITIRVTDGTSYRALPSFSIVASAATDQVEPTGNGRKARYGHYFSSRDDDTVDDLATLCEQAGVQGVIWRRTWYEIEPRPGVYDFGSYDAALRAIANSHNPQCQLWIFVEFKSFNGSTHKNPCPAYLQAQHSALNQNGRTYTCFMWEPVVANAYIKMMRAAAARYDGEPARRGLHHPGIGPELIRGVLAGRRGRRNLHRRSLARRARQYRWSVRVGVHAEPLPCVPELHPQRAGVSQRRFACALGNPRQPRLHVGPRSAAR